jgi:hypothetical protein
LVERGGDLVALLLLVRPFVVRHEDPLSVLVVVPANKNFTVRQVYRGDRGGGGGRVRRGGRRWRMAWRRRSKDVRPFLRVGQDLVGLLDLRGRHEQRAERACVEWQRVGEIV